MQTINWLQVIIGFVSGGAFGAIIKQFFDNRRNRIQAIAQSVVIKPLYDSVTTKLDIEISLPRQDGLYVKFPNLYIVTIEILNTGLVDYKEFKFGITTSEHIKIIQVKPSTSDRHHVAEIDPSPSLGWEVSSFDGLLIPLNRKDKYVFDMLVTTTNKAINATDFQISSSHPIKWTNIVTASDKILEVASKSILDGLFLRIFRI